MPAARRHDDAHVRCGGAAVSTAADVDGTRAALGRLAVRSAFGFALLIAAGFRHHLVWGESARWPWLLPLLNAGEAACLVGFVLLAGSAWWRGMALVDRVPVSTAELLRRSAPVLCAAIVVPCFLSADPIDYVVRGRILALHGANPYVHVATEFPDDPFLAFGDRPWKDMPLPYGPVVAWVQAGVAWLAHLLPVPPVAELVAALVLFKLLFAAALSAAAVALRGVAERLRPGSGARALVAIAWNPLLLLECVATAHNEPLVLLCLALAVAGAVAGRLGPGTFALGIGVLTKIVPALLGPLWFVLALRRRRLRALLLGVAALAPLAALGYWQFFRDPESFGAFRRQAGLSGGSVWWVVQQVFGVPVDRLVAIGRAVVLAWLARCTVRLWRRPEPRELLIASSSSLAALAVLGAPLFGPWYHVWWVPLALVLGAGYLHRAALATSVVAPLGYFVFAGWRRYDDPAAWLGAACVVLPFALAAWRGGGAIAGDGAADGDALT